MKYSILHCRIVGIQKPAHRAILFPITVRNPQKFKILTSKMAGEAPLHHPKFQFTNHPSVSPFAVPQQTYVSQHSKEKYQYIATGALVFDMNNCQNPRVLLLQRSTKDSMPNRWEVPGGGCDDEDESIVYGVARELWEEAGLKAKYIKPPVGEPYFFNTKSGKEICKFVFVVEAEKDAQGQLKVKLDPEEHQQFVWASEEEVKAKRVGDLELEFTTQDLENIVLQSFQQIE
jgi:8-oxo-dGTP pyrophosphatase MutT (NUDIX family)